MSDPGASPRDAVESARLDAALRDLFDHKIVFNEFLGVRIDAFDATHARSVFAMRPELIGHHLHGRLHGGVISSVLDATGGLAIMSAIAHHYSDESATDVMERFRHLGTVDMRIDFLRQGIGERFFAIADVVRLGRRIGTASMRLLNEQDRLIATGTATYIVSS